MYSTIFRLSTIIRSGISAALVKVDRLQLEEIFTLVKIVEYLPFLLGSTAIIAIVLYPCFYVVDRWLKSYQANTFSEKESQESFLGNTSFSGDYGDTFVSVNSCHLDAGVAASECAVNGEAIEGIGSTLEASGEIIESISAFAEAALNIS